MEVILAPQGSVEPIRASAVGFASVDVVSHTVARETDERSSASTDFFITIGIWRTSQMDREMSDVAQSGHSRERRQSAKCRFCCKSRKSNNPENLAKVDLSAAASPFSAATESVVDFGGNDMVPHVAAHKKLSGSRNFHSDTPKRLFQHYLPGADIPTNSFVDRESINSQ